MHYSHLLFLKFNVFTGRFFKIFLFDLSLCRLTLCEVCVRDVIGTKKSTVVVCTTYRTAAGLSFLVQQSIKSFYCHVEERLHADVNHWTWSSELFTRSENHWVKGNASSRVAWSLPGRVLPSCQPLPLLHRIQNVEKMTSNNKWQCLLGKCLHHLNTSWK